MVHLARQYFFALFRPLAFGDVLKAIDRAYDVSIAILDCFDVNERDAARTVRPFDVVMRSRAAVFLANLGDAFSDKRLVHVTKIGSERSSSSAPSKSGRRLPLTRQPMPSLPNMTKRALALYPERQG